MPPSPQQVALRAVEKALEPLAEALDQHPEVRGIVANALLKLSDVASEARKPKRKRITGRALDKIWDGLGLLKRSRTPWEKARELGLRTGQDITKFLAEIVSA